MTKPGLLLWSEDSEQFLDDALLDRFDVVRLWEADDREAMFAERGGEIVATLTSRLDARTLERLPNLRLVVVPGAGYERVDVAAAKARGVTIANAGDTHSGDVADHAVALTLASVHRLSAMDGWVRGGRWGESGKPARRHALSSQRFGIVGLGNIGTAIARRLVPFGGEIAWWGPHDKPSPWPRHESLLALAEWCTVLVVATRGDAGALVDRQTIEAVGPDGLIVNISRGAVVDEDALIEALEAGRLGSAALDVFQEEPTTAERWADVPNVILTPHVAGVSHEAAERLRQAAARNLATVLDGGPLVNEVTA